MTYQPPPDTNAGPTRTTVGNVIFFFVVCALIVGFASLGIFSGERTASNPPTETTVGQGQPAPPTTK
jgi:hypothetical protein